VGAACDLIERPGIDAVALVLYRRGAGGRVEVLLRECTRPAVPHALGDEASPVATESRRFPPAGGVGSGTGGRSDAV